MEITQRTLRVPDLFLRQPKRMLIAFVIIVVLSVLAYVTLGDKTPEEKAQQELAEAVVAVGKLMVLPEGDEPVLATVTDAKTLIAQQAFFTGSVDGDQLLLFPSSLKAIIYSPSRNKIINAGPIEQSADTTRVNTQPQSTIPAETLTVEVRNGTGTAGYAREFAEGLSRSAGYAVTEVADAGRKDYQSTIIFVRTSDENKKSKIAVLATSIGVSATQRLPGGEKSTSADVLVILGGK